MFSKLLSLTSCSADIFASLIPMKEVRKGQYPAVKQLILKRKMETTLSFLTSTTFWKYLPQTRWLIILPSILPRLFGYTAILETEQWPTCPPPCRRGSLKQQRLLSMRDQLARQFLDSSRCCRQKRGGNTLTKLLPLYLYLLDTIPYCVQQHTKSLEPYDGLHDAESLLFASNCELVIQQNYIHPSETIRNVFNLGRLASSQNFC